MARHDDHHHDHSHGDHHDHPSTPHNHGVVANLRVAFFINLVFAIIEIVGGVLTNSVAILADAVHDLGDAVTLAVAVVLERVAGRARTETLTFGYRRFSTLGALITGLVLIAGAILVLTHTVPRILTPKPVDATGMIYFAVLGVVMNGIAAIRLARTESMNAHAVFLHLAEDLLGWIAVLIGAVAIAVWGIAWIDPLLAVGINIFVLARAIPIVIRALKVFLQFTPGSPTTEEIRRELAKIRGVHDVHEIHLWTLDGDYTLFSAHVVPEADRSISELEQCKREVRERLHDLGIDHATIELEAPNAACDGCDL